MNSARKYFLALALVTAAGASTAFAVYHERPFRERLAAYVTDLRDRSHEQRLNIERAGRSVDGVIVSSGEVFSLNRQAGPYSAEKGYAVERSFIEKRLTESEGGGVCQLASTFYNAARLAGMEILERVTHSQPVHSVPAGYDATLAYGVADLKWRNPYPFPVQVRARVSQDQLKVEIWGKELGNEPLEQ